jgi:hypothetical protein
MFPDFPEIDVTIPPGFVDDSWSQDVCPKFVNTDLKLCIWIDYPNKADREFSQSARYCLVRIKPGEDGDYAFGNIPDVIEEGDDWLAILAAITREKQK